MHSAVGDMLQKYHCRTPDDYKKALKEVIQEIALLGLFRANFFDEAAFYGGTALRIFYGLNRFSEDLDFSLLKKTKLFELAPYCEAIKNELNAFGFDVTVDRKQKITDSAVESAFIKTGTLQNLLKIESIHPPITGVAKNELLKIKLEVDVDPPAGAQYDVKYLLTPVPFSVRLYSPDSLLAGKLHAVLCRNWKGQRIKGRDLYDYVWYLSQSIPVNMPHLAKRLQQTGHWPTGASLKPADLIKRLTRKFLNINFEQAKRDVLPFIKDPSVLDLWSADFFISITKDQLKFIKVLM